MRNRAGVPAAIALIALIIVIASGLAQGKEPTAYRLEPFVGWGQLDQVNPYASITAGGSSDGWGNSAGFAQIVGRAVFEPDLSRAEISAEFVPVSREIIASDSRLFIVPLGRRLEWKVSVTVRNPNDVAMTNVKVQNQFGKAFRATVSGCSDGYARILDSDGRGLLPVSSGFSWDIAYIGPEEAAKAELMVFTSQTGGRTEFFEEGVYSIDTGFQLTYRLLGKDEIRNTAPCSAIARSNPSALRADGEPYAVVPKPIEREMVLPQRPIPVRPGVVGSLPVAGGQVSIAPSVRARQVQDSAQILRVHRDDSGNETGHFKLLATGVSDNLGAEDDKFTAPAGEEAEWKMEIWVGNPSAQSSAMMKPQGQPEGWNGWIVTLLFGEHLTAEEIDRLVYVPGHPEIHKGVLTIEEDHPEPGITRVKIIWDWHQAEGNRFSSGSYAYLALKVKTNGLPPSDEDLIFCDQINMEYNPVGSGYWHQVPLDPIYIKSAGEPHADVSMTATRLDWRVCKPGVYAALATKITASGIGKLSIEFSGFEDLSRVAGTPGAIAVLYGFGDDLAAVETGGWISAADLNNEFRYIDLSEPVPVLMWSKINVGEEVSSAEYENEGVITFIASNN